VRTRLILVAALLGSLLFATSAQATGRDANNDRIPDRWEKRHGLSLKVKQHKRDQDSDGFRNRAEWRAKTDPRDADTDGDGIKDSDENAGTVTAYANGELTITLFDGGTLTGMVTEETRLKCEGTDDGTPEATASRHGDDDDPGDDDDDRGDWGHDDDDGHHGDDDGDDDDGHHGDDDGDDDDWRHGDDDGDDDDWRHGDGDWGGHKHGDCDDDECPDDALQVGAAVKEAELKITSEGRVWEELELR
jgi:hypothetical protein